MGKKKHDKNPKISKKDLRKLAEREAAKAAEKKARKKAERKAAEKAAKRARNTEAETVTVATETPEQVAERAKPLKGKALKEAMTADIAAGKDRAEQTAADIDAEIKARLAAKRGSKERTDALQQKVAADRALRVGEGIQDEDGAPYVVDGDGSPVAIETHAGLGEAREKLDDLKAAQGEFAAPTESPLRFEDRVNGLGQYKVVTPDGKERGYTRVTTYIDALEDKTRLTEWKMRLLLEGIAVAETPSDEGQAEPVTARVRDLIHRRDVAIVKARKADRKGKLVPGQLAPLVQAAYSAFKKDMNALVDELFELGGGREKAQKGTDIHALCDLYDSAGIAAVNEKLEAEEITPSDFADVEAYARAMKAIGAEVVAAEQVIVNDEVAVPGEWMKNPAYDKKNPDAHPEEIPKTIGVAGRLDRIVKVKIPELRNAKGEIIYAGDTRARRYVADIKTGNVEYSAGKIAQQIRMYAEGKAYDMETHERTSHGANRTHGLLIHVPAGTGTATIHLVDLGIGGDGNKLASQVRAFRNTGKRAFDTKVDVVAQIPSEDAA